jgi:N-acetylmuramoyl-L-alanine amidase
MKEKFYSFFGVIMLCIIFFPTGAFAQKELVIDAGHGGTDTGAISFSSSNTEKVENLAVALKVRDKLSNSGIKVDMTRSSDTTLSLASRMQIANGYVSGNNDNSLFLSIHHNASTSPYAKGLETYYYDGVNHFDPAYPYDPLQIKYLNDSQRFAQAVHSNVLNEVGMVDRGVHNDSSYYVIRNAQMPSVLVELGFMTNLDEYNNIISSNYQQQQAQAIADAVIAYFKVFDVYQNGNKIATYQREDQAISYAQALSGDMRVWDKNAQQFVWDNSNYQVYHKTNGLLQSFSTEQAAISFAQNNPDTRIVDKSNGFTVWSNFFTPKYTVQASDGTKTQFYDVNQANGYAATKQNAHVIRNSNNQIVWTNVPGEQITRNINAVRLSGATRFLTSISISKDLYPSGFGTVNQDKTVILATGYDAADALSSGPLSSRYGNAPILLNNSADLLPEVRDELVRLGATKVEIIGGTVAISANTESAIQSLGIQTERISGQTRLDTNLQIVNKLGAVNGVLVASSRNFPDAMAAAPIAAANNWAIVLTDQNQISDAALQYLKDKKIVILGGTAAISDNVQNQILQQNSSQNVTRLSGADRYETLASILWYFKDSINSDTINIATGSDFPDAEAAASLSIQNKAPLILVGNGLNKNVESFLYKYTEDNVINNVNVIGGTAAISDSMEGIIIDKAK